MTLQWAVLGDQHCGQVSLPGSGRGKERGGVYLNHSAIYNECFVLTSYLIVNSVKVFRTPAVIRLSLGQSQHADGREQGEQKHLGNVHSEEPKAAENNGPTRATNCAQKGGGKESHLPPRPRTGEVRGKGVVSFNETLSIGGL